MATKWEKVQPINLKDVDLANLKKAGEKLKTEGYDVLWNGEVSLSKVVKILLQQKASESK